MLVFRTAFHILHIALCCGFEQEVLVLAVVEVNKNALVGIATAGAMTATAAIAVAATIAAPIAAAVAAIGTAMEAIKVATVATAAKEALVAMATAAPVRATTVAAAAAAVERDQNRVLRGRSCPPARGGAESSLFAHPAWRSAGAVSN